MTGIGLLRVAAKSRNVIRNAAFARLVSPSMGGLDGEPQGSPVRYPGRPTRPVPPTRLVSGVRVTNLNGDSAMTNTSQAVSAPSLVSIQNGKPTTTSNVIAATFGKRHDTVLRAIDNLECSSEYRLRNFAESSVIGEMPNGGKRSYRTFTVTRDGFVFLAMGFTGKEAAKWKEAYIEAFNQMEATLSKQQAALPNAQKGDKLTPAQLRTLQEAVASRADLLDTKHKAAAYPKLWGALKSHFHIPSYRELPPESFDAALSLLGRLPLEGEYIPSEQKSNGVTLTESEMMNISALLSLSTMMVKHWREVFPALQTLRSPLAHESHDAFNDAAFVLGSLSGVRMRCKQ